ncbi:hypothetical protein H5410_061767 [Solanum commersonii]|uniref:Uncharacterized protein n=1 Tax=Solanum commersonii TaxID=4109 RepID=A0A9J5W8W8_SOLCO|nr:hypothetical protein H5410_061767 [Solanum commersonii]
MKSISTWENDKLYNMRVFDFLHLLQVPATPNPCLKELENEKISKNKIDQEKKEYRDQAIKNNKEPASTNGNISQQPHTVTTSNTQGDQWQTKKNKKNKTNHNNDDRPHSSQENEDTKQHPHN